MNKTTSLENLQTICPSAFTVQPGRTNNYGVTLHRIKRPSDGVNSYVIFIHGNCVGTMSIDTAGTVRLAGDAVQVRVDTVKSFSVDQFDNCFPER